MKTFKAIVLLVLIGAMTLGGLAIHLGTREMPLSDERISFTIPAGSSLQGAAQLIEAAGTKMPAWQLSLLGRALGRASSIKAGSYEIERGLSAIELIDKLTRGDVQMAEVALIEGKTFAQWRRVLNEHPDLAHDTERMSDAEILKSLAIRADSPEGLFLPDTYLIDKGGRDLDVLRRAKSAMTKQLDAAWAMRDPLLPLASPYQLLILASIVEKETGKATDRPQIAAVFVNRLRKGMPLQSDPTVIYGIGARFDGNLRRVDLTTDTPWNTYTRNGLPPTPIAMTGLAALRATSQPPTSTKYYFVARGDGSSQFSATLDEHNSAVNRFQKGNR